MKKRRLYEISFASYLKLIVLTALGLGIVMGLGLFLASLFGGDVHADLGLLQLSGLAGGLASLVAAPLLCVFAGVWLGLLAFLPFRLLLKSFGGLALEMDAPEDHGYTLKK